jgi:hypothetical protein
MSAAAIVICGQLLAALAVGGAIGLVVNLDYGYAADARRGDYTAVMWTNGPDNLSRLAEALRAEAAVREFRLAPIGD